MNDSGNALARVVHLNPVLFSRDFRFYLGKSLTQRV